MTLKELKDFINKVPIEMNNFLVVNGQIGAIDESGDNDKTVYRVDDSVIAIYVDEIEKQVCLFHQTQENIKDILKKQY